MKKSILLCLAALCLATTAAADQLMWVSGEVARQAVQLLEKQHAVLLHCGCCDGDSKTYVKLASVSCRPVHTEYFPNKDYHEVWIEGVDADGHPVWTAVDWTAVDLAYIHIQNGEMALCGGKALTLECDPCVENNEDFHEVWLEGVDADGHPVSAAVDLAYVHIQNGNKALCVGKALNLECDPCIENLEWECPDF